MAAQTATLSERADGDQDAGVGDRMNVLRRACRFAAHHENVVRREGEIGEGQGGACG
jgi:hypothetical protein